MTTQLTFIRWNWVEDERERMNMANRIWVRNDRILLALRLLAQITQKPSSTGFCGSPAYDGILASFATGEPLHHCSALPTTAEQMFVLHNSQTSYTFG